MIRVVQQSILGPIYAFSAGVCLLYVRDDSLQKSFNFSISCLGQVLLFPDVLHFTYTEKLGHNNDSVLYLIVYNV
ncbi:hypothetical protein AG4045_014015 [Apium graveolens]|uniref:Uncharacterized protein n=1 Tax=Apium graveolens TaxID=4045 RepID=A0A6L5BBG3_APIGR|nr:hypothetical protein AG4045_014015 [Apium graveolens]